MIAIQLQEVVGRCLNIHIFVLIRTVIKQAKIIIDDWKKRERKNERQSSRTYWREFFVRIPVIFVFNDGGERMRFVPSTKNDSTNDELQCYSFHRKTGGDVLMCVCSHLHCWRDDREKY